MSWLQFAAAIGVVVVVAMAGAGRVLHEDYQERQRDREDGRR